MKTLNIFRNFFLLTLVIAAASCTPEDGTDGTEGEQGPAGQDGNANVATYEFSIERNDWGPNLHYGSNNIKRAFEVTPELINGTEIINSYYNGDAVISYVRPVDSGYNELFITPFSGNFQRPDASQYGVRIDYSPTRGSLHIARTEHGFDSQSIVLDDIPGEIDVRMIIIDASSFSGRSQAQSFEVFCENHGVDFSNYEEVLLFARSL